MRTNLLDEIKEFMAEAGIGKFNFGFRAVKNGRLVERLEEGARIWPDTEMKVRAFMAAERMNMKPEGKKGRAA